MLPKTPRQLAFLVLFALLAAAPAALRADDKTKPKPAPPPLLGEALPIPGKPAVPDKEELKPAPELVKFLDQQGYKVKTDLSILRVKDNLILNKELLERAGMKYSEEDPKGHLVYASTGKKVEWKLLVKILDGLAPFARAQYADPMVVGKQLRAWGVPPVFNGNHLLNPDGSATYYGLMFFEGIKDKPAAVRQLSGERLARSLSLFESAFHQAFTEGTPDIAYTDLNRAWDMLKWDKPAPGETLLKLQPMTGAGMDLAQQQKSVEAVRGTTTDPKAKADMEKALTALSSMQKYRYHSDLALPPVPNPGKKGGAVTEIGPGGAVPGPGGELEGPKSLDTPAPPSQRLLPALLRVLDRVNGKPLTPVQQEWLIKSFPMGELVWRMGAQDLWRDELAQRQQVKVAVIDSGAGNHPDLKGKLNRQDNFTPSRANVAGNHATHVSGIIASLVGDGNSEINSYRVLTDGDFLDNPRLADHTNTDKAIIAAIHKAVADGNQVINLSLGGGGHASDDVSQLIDKYSKEKGIIFVVAAGNEGARGVSSPSTAKSALTIGAVNINDRVTGFSSFGAGWDPLRVSYSIKKVLLAPGDDIVSTTAPKPYDKAPYMKMSGTSMAAPATSGIVALLYQQAKSLNLATDPVALSQIVQDALASTAKPIPRNQLDPRVPVEQEFLIIDPAAAYQALREKASVAKK